MVKWDPDIAPDGHHWIHHDDALARKTRASLFKQFDEDESGTIKQKEFDKLYDMIHTHVEEEFKERIGMMKRLLRGRRRLVALAFLAAILLIFLCVSVAANAAAIFVIVDSVVTTKSAGDGLLVSKESGEIAKTAVSYSSFDSITDLLSLDVTDLEELTTLTLTGDDGSLDHYKIEGFTRGNASALTFYTSRGDELVVSLLGIETISSTGRRLAATSRGRRTRVKSKKNNVGLPTTPGRSSPPSCPRAPPCPPPNRISLAVTGSTSEVQAYVGSLFTSVANNTIDMTPECTGGACDNLPEYRRNDQTSDREQSEVQLAVQEDKTYKDKRRSLSESDDGTPRSHGSARGVLGGGLRELWHTIPAGRRF